MARARNIKPGFFINDKLAEVEPLGRLLFIGLWTIADREGRLEDRPCRIKVQTLPYDNCDPDALLNQLQVHNFILRYAVGGCPFIQIINFTKHQHPHVQEKPSEIPAPGEQQLNTEQAPDKYHTNPEQEPDKHHTDPSGSLIPITESFNTTTENVNPVQTGCSTILKFYEKNFPGTISPLVAEKLEAWLEEVNGELVICAMEKAVLAEKRTYAYVDGILKNWRGQGINTRKDAELAETRYQQRKGRVRESPAEELPRAYMTRREQLERGIINDGP